MWGAVVTQNILRDHALIRLLAAGRCRALLSDLDGETVAYAKLADTVENVSRFVDRLFRRPWEIVGRRPVLRKVVRRILAARTRNPVYWYIQIFASLHCFVWARAYPPRRRSYMAGEDVLDPQYGACLDGVSEADLRRYFEPVAPTDASGCPAGWLEPYLARRAAGSGPQPRTPRLSSAGERIEIVPRPESL